MHGGEDEAAGAEVLAHDLTEQIAVGRIEGGERLVEKPEWSGAREEPAKRQAPPLARRKHANLQVQEAREPKAFGGKHGGGFGPAAPAPLEKQFVQRPTTRFQAVLVA